MHPRAALALLWPTANGARPPPETAGWIADEGPAMKASAGGGSTTNDAPASECMVSGQSE